MFRYLYTYIHRHCTSASTLLIKQKLCIHALYIVSHLRPYPDMNERNIDSSHISLSLYSHLYTYAWMCFNCALFLSFNMSLFSMSTLSLSPCLILRE